ncbi:MAG: peptide ABC transporter ATP-binding protein, partial [Caldimonas sp.]
MSLPGRPEGEYQSAPHEGAPVSGEALLRVEDLVKHFPVRRGLWASGPPAAVRAVDGISFDIRRGET